MSAKILVLALMIAVPAFAKTTLNKANALTSIESTAEVKAIYKVYFSKHKKGDCSGCALVGEAQISKAEKSTIKTSDCSEDLNGRGELYCEAVVTKEIYTNDDYIQELKIKASLFQDAKGAVFSTIKNIEFQQELND